MKYWNCVAREDKRRLSVFSIPGGTTLGMDGQSKTSSAFDQKTVKD